MMEFDFTNIYKRSLPFAVLISTNILAICKTDLFLNLALLRLCRDGLHPLLRRPVLVRLARAQRVVGPGPLRVTVPHRRRRPNLPIALISDIRIIRTVTYMSDMHCFDSQGCRRSIRPLPSYAIYRVELLSNT